MVERILFIAENKLCVFSQGKLGYLTSQPLNMYRRNVMDIQRRNEWKSVGTGARFMYGEGSHLDFENYDATDIASVSFLNDDTMVYALNIERNTGIHVKNILDDKEPEGFIIRKNNMNIFKLDYQAETGRIAVCASDSAIERHIVIFNDKNTDYHFVTEGDCLDQNPSWSKLHKDTIFYDSCGIARDGTGSFAGFGPRCICKLSLDDGGLSEIASDEKSDFIKPFEDSEGNVYYMKKPYKMAGAKETMSFRDIVLMPLKLCKAIFGWLNFFTQRYSGQSLKTSGGNPAQAREKSAEEMFIEGNLVNVLKAQKENEKLGDQHPGLVPRSWELIKKQPDGKELVLKKGLLDFHVCENGDIIYSNGNYLMKMDSNGNDSMLAKVKLAASLVGINRQQG